MNMLRLTMLFCVALVALPVLPAFAQAPSSSQGLSSSQGIAVPARDIARGETISAGDLTSAEIAPGQMRAGIAVSANEIAGMQARRYLRAGELVRTDDLRRPVVVTKGQSITMHFEVPGISLVATGKALSEGGVGDSVTVLNPVSYRQILATVTGPGTVRAESALSVQPARIAALRP